MVPPLCVSSFNNRRLDVSAYLDEQFDDFDVAVGARAVDGKGPEVVAVVCVRAAA